MTPTRPAFNAAEPRPEINALATSKKNYAERLSRQLARIFSDGLRAQFPGITPDADGGRQEAPARTAKGVKKLDVNYSTPELGLGLGVSLKTINFRDQKTNRYTKNYTRVDNELRAEAQDYHVRQPYSVLAGVVFLPEDSCDDGSKNTPSSFGSAVRCFRYRSERAGPRDESELFEKIFLGLYDRTGATIYFDVANDPPWAGKPPDRDFFNFAGVVREIARAYNDRNNPPFRWSDRDEQP